MSPARDDVQGASAYSYLVTATSGQEPDFIADGVFGTSDCRLTAVVYAGITPGPYYFSIQARVAGASCFSTPAFWSSLHNANMEHGS